MVTEIKVLKVYVTSDDRDKHLPFLKECSKGNHHLELVRNGYICCQHLGISTKSFIEVNV
jgi:hypothetical protein